MPVAIPLAIVGAGVASAAIGSSAAKSAAQTQATAANKATDTQLQMFNQTQANLAPFRDLGTGAGSSLSKLLGIGVDQAPATPAPQIGDLNVPAWLQANPDVAKYYAATPAAQTMSLEDFAKSIATQQAGIRNPITPYTARDIANYVPPRTPQELALESLPGYQFAKSQGIQSANRTLGSMGATGAQLKGISRFVTGLADSTYGAQADRLQALTNTGEAAAAGQANSGAAFSGGISNTITGAGQAIASGQVGSANAITGGLSSIPSALLTNSILNGGKLPGASTPGIYGTSSNSSITG